jgi:hypothetical protein
LELKYLIMFKKCMHPKDYSLQIWPTGVSFPR